MPVGYSVCKVLGVIKVLGVLGVVSEVPVRSSKYFGRHSIAFVF